MYIRKTGIVDYIGWRYYGENNLQKTCNVKSAKSQTDIVWSFRIPYVCPEDPAIEWKHRVEGIVDNDNLQKPVM